MPDWRRHHLILAPQINRPQPKRCALSVLVVRKTPILLEPCLRLVCLSAIQSICLLETKGTASSVREQMQTQSTHNDNNKYRKWISKEVRRNRSARYRDADGLIINSRQDVERIKSLVIPPAWTDVRINPAQGGKLQVVGIDKVGYSGRLCQDI